MSKTNYAEMQISFNLNVVVKVLDALDLKSLQRSKCIFKNFVKVSILVIKNNHIQVFEIKFPPTNSC